MKESFTIKFFLNKNVSKTQSGVEYYKIYCRVTKDRKKSEFATGVYEDEKVWHKNGGRSNKSAVNDELAEVEHKLRRLRRRFLDDEKFYTAKSLVQSYKNNGGSPIQLISYINKHIEEITLKEEHAINTINHYKASRNIYAAFVKKIYKQDDIFINQLDFEFVNKFDLYLMKKHKDALGRNIKRNTANKHHSRLRTLLHKAVKEDIIGVNPYSNFQLKNKPSNRTYLTSEEVTRIRDLDFSNNRSLDRVRDFFLFSCYTSLRYSDAYELKKDDILVLESGTKLISIEMEKTKEAVQIPIVPDAERIIEKYKDDAARVIHGFILPRYSNQKLNNYLKQIGVMANLTKELSHHVARHTFATVALNNGIPIEAVQKILGHNNLRTTQVYAKMMTSTLEKEMEKFKL